MSPNHDGWLQVTVNDATRFSIRCVVPTDPKRGRIEAAVALMQGFGPMILPELKSILQRSGGTVGVVERVGLVTHLRVTLPTRSSKLSSRLARCSQLAITLHRLNSKL